MLRESFEVEIDLVDDLFNTRDGVEQTLALTRRRGRVERPRPETP